MKKLFYALLFSAIAFQLSAASQPWFAAKLPGQLINAQGKKVNTAAVLQGKLVAVYFSASWCGPCRSFTPKLIEFYKEVKKTGKLELVFISSDYTEKDMMKYMQKMPWYAVQFKHPAATILKNELQVRGIPTLVVYDSQGKLITRDGRRAVTELGANALDVWSSAAPDKAYATAAKANRKSQKKNK